MKFTPLNLFLLLICFSLCNGCGSKNKENAGKANPNAGAPPPPGVEGFIVKSAPVSDRLELAGSILANEATEIHPEIAGRLTFLDVSEGKKVSRGSLLAKIYDGDLRAQLNKLRVQLEVQEQTARRYEELLKINGVSQQEYDLIKLQSSNIRADMEVVRSNIMRTEIRAPFPEHWA